MNGYLKHSFKFVSVIGLVVAIVATAPIGVIAHEEDQTLDGNATVTNGDVQPAPYANSTFNRESQRMIFEFDKSGNAEVKVLYVYRAPQYNKSQYPYTNTSSPSYTLFEQEVTAMLQALASDAERKTGRDMSVTLVDTRHNYDKSQGYTLQFEYSWTGLAAVREDGALVVSEPFASDHSAFTEAADSHGAYAHIIAPYGGNPGSYWRFDLSAVGDSDVEVKSGDTKIATGTFEPSQSLVGTKLVMAANSETTSTHATSTTAPQTTSTTNSQPTLPVSVILAGLVGVVVLAAVILHNRR